MFPVETISAKMLDYYVDRRDTLIIDLRERESYAHKSCKRRGEYAIRRNRGIYIIS